MGPVYHPPAGERGLGSDANQSLLHSIKSVEILCHSHRVCSLKSGMDLLTHDPHLQEDIGALKRKQEILHSSGNHSTTVTSRNTTCHLPQVKDTRRCFLVPGKQGSPKV